MLYFKNTELAESQHVSLRTVLNWVEAVKQGKLDLTLHEKDGKAYVANTTRNNAIIEQLVEDGRKYRNKRGFKTVSPQPRFYKIYNQQQILDIIWNLDVYQEIPQQYNYFDQGAHNWDKYSQRLAKESTPNALTNIWSMLTVNQGFLDKILASVSRVNVIDVGIGNVLPARYFIENLLERGQLGRYIGVDISTEMLQIAKNNVQKWFSDRVAFEGYEHDINYGRLSDVTFDNYASKYPDTMNIFLIFGGTLANLRSPSAAFRVIHDSMRRNDLLIHDQKPDTTANRRHFDFNSTAQTVIEPDERFILDLLNIDDSFYEVEMGYDNILNQRYIRVRFKVALELRVDLSDGDYSLMFNKGDTILLLRIQHQDQLSALKQYDDNGFAVLQASKTDDEDYLMTFSRLKRSQ